MSLYSFYSKYIIVTNISLISHSGRHSSGIAPMLSTDCGQGHRSQSMCWPINAKSKTLLSHWFNAPGSQESHFSSPCDIVNSQSWDNQSVSLSVGCLCCRQPLGHAVEIINARIYLSNWFPTRREGLWWQLSRGWRDSSTPVFSPSLLLFNEEEWRITAGFASAHDNGCFSSYLWCVSVYT